jgi:hypothetical protein
MKKSKFYRLFAKDYAPIGIAESKGLNSVEFTADNGKRMVLIEDLGYVFEFKGEHFAISKSEITTHDYFTVTHIESGCTPFLSGFKTIKYAIQSLTQYDYEMVEKVKRGSANNNPFRKQIDSLIDYSKLNINTI